MQSRLTHALDIQLRTLTVRFGLMLLIGLSLTIAVLRLWSG